MWCSSLRSKKGKRSTLFVPEGLEGQGWRSFGEMLGLVLSQNPPKRIRGENAKVFGRVRREDISFAQAVVGRNLEVCPPKSLVEDVKFLFDTSKCLLVVRERVVDSWDNIERAIRNFLGDNTHL